MKENVKVFLWRIIKGPKLWLEYVITSKKYSLKGAVMNSKDTIQYILEHHCSVCRFGDGELQMISHYLSGGNMENYGVDTFQNYVPQLARRLMDVLSSLDERVLVCIPYPLLRPSVYKGYDSLFFVREWNSRARMLTELVKRSVLGDTTFTRFYLHRRDIKDYDAYIKSLKCLWEGRNVVIVEGEFSRLGVGNDLFNNASEIRRVICPSRNAFDNYAAILNEVSTFPKDTLLLLALGHTATVLAYDLSNLGYQAMDLGHVDIEYEWLRMGAKKKIPVKNKYVNEVSTGRINVADTDIQYDSQIVARIL